MPIAVRRAADKADFEAFRALADEYEASLPDDLRHADFATQRRDMAAHYRPPNAAFIADEDGRHAGCVAWTARAERIAVVKKMYVVPAYRKRGVARALMLALVACARECGFERLVLDTARERMQPAYALYLALGFRECEPYGEVDYRCPTFMELDLS